MDGLRLDATHYLFDDSPRHFLAELAATVRASIRDRAVHLIAEDPRNLAAMIRAESEGGWGLDALWSDDFHHELRRYLVGDFEGVFKDFQGTVAGGGPGDQPGLALLRRVLELPRLPPRHRPDRPAARGGSSSSSRTTTGSATAPWASG